MAFVQCLKRKQDSDLNRMRRLWGHVQAARRDILVQEAAAEEESSREALIPSMQLLDRLQARLADVQARWSEQNGRYQVGSTLQ